MAPGLALASAASVAAAAADACAWAVARSFAPDSASGLRSPQSPQAALIGRWRRLRGSPARVVLGGDCCVCADCSVASALIVARRGILGRLSSRCRQIGLEVGRVLLAECEFGCERGHGCFGFERLLGGLRVGGGVVGRHRFACSLGDCGRGCLLGDEGASGRSCWRYPAGRMSRLSGAWRPRFRPAPWRADGVAVGVGRRLAEGVRGEKEHRQTEQEISEKPTAEQEHVAL